MNIQTLLRNALFNAVVLGLLLVLTLILWMTPTVGATPLSTSIEISSVDLDSDSTGTVMLSLKLQSPTQWGAGTFLIHYDPAEVEPTTCTVESGIIGSCNPIYTDMSGTKAVRLAVASPTIVSQDINVASIQFSKAPTASASAQVTLSPHIITLADSNGSPLTASVESGIISWGQSHEVFLPILVR